MVLKHIETSYATNMVSDLRDKVQFRKISEFVAAISVVLIDDLTISLLNKNPPAAGRGRPKRQACHFKSHRRGAQNQATRDRPLPRSILAGLRPRSGHPASPEPRMEGPDKCRLLTIFNAPRPHCAPESSTPSNLFSCWPV